MNLKNYKPITLILLSGILTGLIIIAIRTHQKNELLKDNALRLSEKEVELSSVLEAIGQQYQYTNYKIRDFNIISSGKFQTFSSLLNNQYRIFFKFSSSDCIECIKSELKLLKNTALPIMLLIETKDSRWLKAFIESEQIASNAVFQIEESIIKDSELPFYFVTNQELHTRDILFPVKELPFLSVNYYQIMQNKYFNNY